MSVPDLGDEILKLHRRIDSVQQAKPYYPVCTVALQGNADISTGDTYALGGWLPVGSAGDPDSLFSPYVSGGGNPPGFIAVPYTGRYHLHLAGVFASLTNAVVYGDIWLGYPSGTLIREAVKPSAATGTRDTSVDVIWEDLFSEGDQIFWSFGASSTLNLRGDPTGHKTRMYLRYIGSR